MQLQSLIDTLETIAPIAHAEEWDNVGLLVGDARQPVSKVMLAIDYTPAVADETRAKRCDCVIAYHPPIFQPVKRVIAGGATNAVFHAIRNGIAIYSPHTALDVAEGGTNDVLADAIALTDRRPLKMREGEASLYKLVTFAPVEAAERVAEALFAAGAGKLGDYSRCSFRSPGTGTFFAEEGANPAVGAVGQLERADEIRIETIVPIGCADAVVAALRKAHPYEEPAFDLQTLAAEPTGVGLGRVGRLPGDATADMLANMLKRAIGVSHLLIAGESGRLIKRAAVCAGACGGDLLSAAIDANVDLYITGEMRHHDALRAVQNNITVICTLHSNSERIALSSLRTRITAAHPELEVFLSQADRDPFSIL